MSIQKNFVIKNGVEINSNLIFGDAVTDRVGIGTTRPTDTLHVVGGIAGTSINLTGVGTIPTLRGTSLNYTTLVVTGVSTLGIVGISTLNVSGIATLGTVQISSGIVTASSGIVTYYGDGQYLQNILSGVGVATVGGTVGTGATILDFRGAGISTVTVSAGIATINIEGGGGGGAVSIGATAPTSPSSGDLWYSPEYGRTFVWYDEVALGIGSTAVWVDAAPFNVNLSQLDDLQVNSLVVVNHTDLNTLDVSGISTLGNVVIGSGVTDLIVNGDARVTGILTIGTSSLTLNGNTNQINGVTISSGIITASNSNSLFNSNPSTITSSHTIPENTNSSTVGPVGVDTGVTIVVSNGSYWKII